MDRDFIREYYRTFYTNPQQNAVEGSKEFIAKREIRYKREEEFIEILGKADTEANRKFNEFLDAYADEIEILLEEMYLMGASDREKMLRE